MNCVDKSYKFAAAACKSFYFSQILVNMSANVKEKMATAFLPLPSLVSKI